MWVTKLLISPVKIRIGIFVHFWPAHLVPCWWIGWWLWRAGCISQDTYLLYGNDLISGVLKLPLPAFCDTRQQHHLPRAVAVPDEDFHTKVFAKTTTITRAYRLHYSGDHQLGRPSGSQSGARGFARGHRLPHMQVITIMIEEDFVREVVKNYLTDFFR